MPRVLASLIALAAIAASAHAQPASFKVTVSGTGAYSGTVVTVNRIDAATAIYEGSSGSLFVQFKFNADGSGMWECSHEVMACARAKGFTIGLYAPLQQSYKVGPMSAFPATPIGKLTVSSEPNSVYQATLSP